MSYTQGTAKHVLVQELSLEQQQRCWGNPGSFLGILPSQPPGPLRQRSGGDSSGSCARLPPRSRHRCPCPSSAQSTAWTPLSPRTSSLAHRAPRTPACCCPGRPAPSQGHPTACAQGPVPSHEPPGGWGAGNTALEP